MVLFHRQCAADDDWRASFARPRAGRGGAGWSAGDGRRLAGRRLRAPRGGLRPTADRVRESVFARLGELEGVAVLDLYAGTGALGIEALSRGAASLVSVERARGVVAVIRANLEALDLRSVSRVMAIDVVGAVRSLGRAGAHFDLVLADPPYAAGEALAALEALVEAEVLAPGAVVVLERGKESSFAVRGGAGGARREALRGHGDHTFRGRGSGGRRFGNEGRRRSAAHDEDAQNPSWTPYPRQLRSGDQRSPGHHPPLALDLRRPGRGRRRERGEGSHVQRGRADRSSSRAHWRASGASR